jgi:hypothetical protein
VTKEEIQEISQWASQPRENVWRKWLALLRGKPGVTEHDLLAYKPHIPLVCEPLFGRRIKMGGSNALVAVRPSLKRRIKIYSEALDIIREFCQVDDLLRLGVFRREVTQIAGLEEIDRPFYELVLRDMHRITPQQLRRLSQRMPTGSAIQKALVELGEGRSLPLAAE